MNEKMVNIAMEIILNAGDARNHAADAMTAELEGDHESADSCMRKAKDSIKDAHNAQTNVISEEAAGGKTELSLLFVHAQDTVMTITSEVNMVEMMIKMNRHLEEKFNGSCK
jgi:PTS system cellobiose-specific IIA component